MIRSRSKRERIRAAFDDFHGAAAAALGSAARLREAAVRAQAEVMFELWLRREGLEAARADPSLAPAFAAPLLAGAVARVEADRAHIFDAWLADGPRRLARLMADAAQGPAGEDPEQWLGLRTGKSEGVEDYPQLWRIGSGRLAIGERFPVGVPLLDESHLRVDSTHETRADAEALVELLLLRVLSTFRPGIVSLQVWDVGQFSGALPGLYPLTRTGLLTVHDPANVDSLLGELSDRIRKVQSRVLVGGYPSLRAHAADEGRRSEPWVIAVLAGNRSALPEEQHRQLQRIARGGLACGIQLVLLDVPTTVAAPIESVRFTPEGVRCSMTGPDVVIEPDAPPAREAVTTACAKIVAAHEEWRRQISTFADLLPPVERRYQEKSVTGVVAPIGFDDGMYVELALDDNSPHALIGGPSGSGKTNLLLAMIGSMAARYPPGELEFYLLDFKEGVSFARFAPGGKDETWLPHAKLIGVNANSDREFGLALLAFLGDEMRRRADAAKAHEVSKLEELRAEDPEGHWPRIVAVVDEFQYLFAERDHVTRQATLLLEDLARRGRSQGIHLVFASQDVGGIEAFWGRSAIFEQFVLRIALPRARRVLANLNDAALTLPRWHAIVNHESGQRHANEIARIPDASARGLLDEVQVTAYQAFADKPPRVFDGARAPQVEALLEELVPGPPQALVGQLIDVAGTPAVVRLPAAPGRNVAVLANGWADAARVLTATATALAASAPEEASFLVVPLIGEIPGLDEALAGRAVETVGTERSDCAASVSERSGRVASIDTERSGRAASIGTERSGRAASIGTERSGRAASIGTERSGRAASIDTERSRRAGSISADVVRARLEALAAEIAARVGDGAPRAPVYLLLVGADAADPLLGRAGTETLRKVLRFGPEVGVHVIGWWRSPARLRALLTLGAGADDIGAWIALDVQGSELGALAPGFTPSWSPRPGRGLFFDRSQHAQPEVVLVPS